MPTGNNSRIRIARGTQSNLQVQDFPEGTLFYEKDTALLKIGNGSSASAGSDNEHGHPLYTRGIASNQSGNIGGSGSGNRLYYKTNGALSGVFSSLSLKDTSKNSNFSITNSEVSASTSSGKSEIVLNSSGTLSATLQSGVVISAPTLSATHSTSTSISSPAVTFSGNGSGVFNISGYAVKMSASSVDVSSTGSVNLTSTGSVNFTSTDTIKLSAASITTDGILAHTGAASFGGNVVVQSALTVSGSASFASGAVVLDSSGSAGQIKLKSSSSTSSSSYFATIAYSGSKDDTYYLSPTTGTGNISTDVSAETGGGNFGTFSLSVNGSSSPISIKGLPSSIGADQLLVGNGNSGTSAQYLADIIDSKSTVNSGYIVYHTGSSSSASDVFRGNVRVGINGFSGVTTTVYPLMTASPVSSYVANSVLYASNASAISSVSAPAASASTISSSYNSVLYKSSSDAVPAWGKLTMDSIGGQLAINVSASETGPYYILGRSGTSGGNIGSQLYFNTGCSISGNRITAGSYLATSDINLKENIQDFVETKSILDVPIHRYTWKESKEEDIGFIAQELEKQFPELVLGKEGHKTIKESKFVYYLMDEVKRQKARIDVLEKLIQE